MAPSFGAATDVDTFDALMGLNKSQRTTVWSSNFQTTYSAADMNTQFAQQGFRIVPYDEWDANDTTSTQGILVIGIDACADATLKGQVTISYDCTLLKSKVSDESFSLEDIRRATGTAGADPIYDMADQLALVANHVNPVWTVTRGSVANSLYIAQERRSPFIIEFIGASTNAVVLDVAPVVFNGTITLLHVHLSADSCFYMYLVRPTHITCGARFGSTTPALWDATSTLRVQIRAISRRMATKMLTW
jgi:hypothetical protein